jgi:hypothetical protein
MGINLATRFDTKLSNLLKAERKSQPFTNQDYSWDGSNAIIVSTLTDPTIVDYDVNGASANRYGNSTEVEDTQQTWTLSRDRSWSKTIDKKNFQDSMEIRKPGAYLAQATRNVLIPEIDTYVFQTIETAGEAASRHNGTGFTTGATTSSNAYTQFTAMNANVTDQEAPENGRVSAMTASYYNFLKQSGFVLASDAGQKKHDSGDLGEVDGVKVYVVPSGRMPTNTDCFISHPSVCVAPEKLVDYTLHDNPPGVSGKLLEYRHRYDAFVDTNRTGCIAIHKTA